MVVQQHILNWLYSVLTSEYHDVNRTYNDVAQALSNYPSLSPKTDVHTFPTGTSALLLHLSGTIPVLFRGTTYRFPISIWIPHAYPREAPIFYVTPTENMVVRPGQHVDPQGQVYHPYLAGWPTFWDKSTLLDFLAILREVFAKEPPVIARQASRPPPQQAHTPTPPPVPPLPPDLAPRPTSQMSSPPQEDGARPPPPPPPKPGAPTPVQSPPYQQPPVPQNPQNTRNNGPPLPPLPPSLARPASGYGPGIAQAGSPPPAQAGPSRYDSAPPLPTQPRQQGRTASFPGQPAGGAVANGRAVIPTTGYPPGQHPQHSQPPFPPGTSQHIPGAAYSQPSQNYAPPPNWQPPHGAAPQPQLQPKPKAPPPPDLMDDDLSLAIPSPSSVPAPPIPPNPEKDALLHQLAQTLHSMRQRSRAQNESSLQGLQAQRTAMLNAMSNMQADMSALTQLSALLSSNTAILQDSIRRANGVIENSTQHPAPEIDDLLVAQTVVGNQLYDLVAEERALADAIFVLGRAVEHGRIAPSTFAKMTRSLAREWYLKKALVRKIGLGMGLVRV